MNELQSCEEPFEGVKTAREFLSLPIAQGIIQGPRGHTDEVTHAPFAHAGTQVVTASRDKTPRVWRVGWKDLMTYLRSKTSVCLTIPQRRQYLAEELDEATAKYQACEREYGRTP